MIELVGRLVCRNADEASAVRAHLPEHIRLTRAEPGCLSFEVSATVDPLVWTVAERFASRRDFEAHQARAGASDWARATAGIARDYTVSEIEG